MNTLPKLESTKEYNNNKVMEREKVPNTVVVFQTSTISNWNSGVGTLPWQDSGCETPEPNGDGVYEKLCASKDDILELIVSLLFIKTLRIDRKQMVPIPELLHLTLRFQ